jgi:flagellar FliJ protein
MKQKKFTLESVLTYRRSLEDQALTEFLNVKEILGREERQLHRLFESQNKSIENLKECQTRPVDPNEIRLHQDYVQKVRLAVEAQLRRVAEISHGVAEHRERLLSSTQDKKALEKLKERHLDAAETEMKREDKKTMDACAKMGYLRNGS